MAMEAVIYQQDSFIYTCKDYNYTIELENQNAEILDINGEFVQNGYWDSPPLAQTTTSSPETCGGAAGGGTFFTGGVLYSPEVAPLVSACRRKRRRTKSLKNKEEMENQRMTHIAVERNRRRQMNDYLAVLRSLMPPSYAQRGDQASIVGGAINFVKELEQLLQFLETHKSIKQQQQQLDVNITPSDDVFSNFFTFPQYTMRPSINSPATTDTIVERRSSIAKIEVTMAESHANIKILSKRQPRQLLKMVAGFHSIFLNILHLNITTIDQSVLYSFSVKVEDECQLTTVSEIANAVHDLVGMIQKETATSSRDSSVHDLVGMIQKETTTSSRDNSVQGSLEKTKRDLFCQN